MHVNQSLFPVEHEPANCCCLAVDFSSLLRASCEIVPPPPQHIVDSQPLYIIHIYMIISYVKFIHVFASTNIWCCVKIDFFFRQSVPLYCYIVCLQLVQFICRKKKFYFLWFCNIHFAIIVFPFRYNFFQIFLSVMITKPMFSRFRQAANCIDANYLKQENLFEFCISLQWIQTSHYNYWHTIHSCYIVLFFWWNARTCCIIYYEWLCCLCFFVLDLALLIGIHMLQSSVQTAVSCVGGKINHCME